MLFSFDVVLATGAVGALLRSVNCYELLTVVNTESYFSSFFPEKVIASSRASTTVFNSQQYYRRHTDPHGQHSRENTEGTQIDQYR